MISTASDGFGGILFQISFCDIYHSFFPDESIEAHFICSEPVAKLVKAFLPDYISPVFHKDGSSDIELCKKFKTKDLNTFCLTPDLMGVYPGFELPPQITWPAIKRNQFLYKQFPPPDNNHVFLALITAQDNNSYKHNQELIETLCVDHPNYKFYFADVKSWSGKSVKINCNLEQLAAAHSNFILYSAEDIINVFLFMAREIRYFLTIDNGVANFAHFLGRERMYLDSRYNGLAFKVRWRQTEEPLLPIDTSPKEVSRIFGLAANNTELNGISKRYMLGLSNEQLFNAMIYKGKTKFN